MLINLKQHFSTSRGFLSKNEMALIKTISIILKFKINPLLFNISNINLNTQNISHTVGWSGGVVGLLTDPDTMFKIFYKVYAFIF